MNGAPRTELEGNEVKGSTIVYLLVIAWAVIFVGTIVLALNIDGPRNIDTGFKRLDSLVRGQLLAIVVAFAAGAAGFVFRDVRKHLVLVGLIPIISTIVLAAGVFLFAIIQTNQTTGNLTPAPMPQTTTAEPAPTPDPGN